MKFAGESENSNATKEAPQGKADDETPDSEIDPSRYFISKSPYVRGAVVFAGPFFNYLLAIAVYMGMFAIHGVSTIPDTRVGEVVEGSTADSVGLMVDDRITAVDGGEVTDWDALVGAISDGTGTTAVGVAVKGLLVGSGVLVGRTIQAMGVGSVLSRVGGNVRGGRGRGRLCLANWVKAVLRMR